MRGAVLGVLALHCRLAAGQGAGSGGSVWVTVDSSTACQGGNCASHESMSLMRGPGPGEFQYHGSLYPYQDLDYCKLLCESTVGCWAINYFSVTNRCLMLTEGGCPVDFTCGTGDGASHYELTARAAVTSAPAPGGWVTLSLVYACQFGSCTDHFGEYTMGADILPAGQGLPECRLQCDNTAFCTAVNFYARTRMCEMLRSTGCPLDSTCAIHDGASYSERTAVPGPATDSPTDSSGRRRLPLHDGCDSVTDPTECCNVVDGRFGTSFYLEKCIPSLPGQNYNSGATCEPWNLLQATAQSHKMDTCPDTVCQEWGCTCQGFSDHFGSRSGFWFCATGNSAAIAWWTDNACNTVPGNTATLPGCAGLDCSLWGCTCQGFSNYFGTTNGVTWGCASDISKTWYGAVRCALSAPLPSPSVPPPFAGCPAPTVSPTTSACVPWGCTCQGFSDHFGSRNGFWFCADGNLAAQTWWSDQTCDTAPSTTATLPGCPGLDCTLWGCTCQGFSDYFGTSNGLTWGCASDISKTWYAAVRCGPLSNPQANGSPPFPGCPAPTVSPTAAVCAPWGCTCQGFSDHFGSRNPNFWFCAEGNPTAQTWWSDESCNSEPSLTAPVLGCAGLDCSLWGCTCQGFSDYYGARTGITWGCSPAIARTWFAAVMCGPKVFPQPSGVAPFAGCPAPTASPTAAVCAPWGCTCQGFSDHFGSRPAFWFCADGNLAAQTWWSDESCSTSPNVTAELHGCPGLDCSLWGCTCQGFANYYGAYTGSSWGCTPEGIVRTWPAAVMCSIRVNPQAEGSPPWPGCPAPTFAPQPLASVETPPPTQYCCSSLSFQNAPWPVVVHRLADGTLVFTWMRPGSTRRRAAAQAHDAEVNLYFPPGSTSPGGYLHGADLHIPGDGHCLGSGLNATVTCIGTPHCAVYAFVYHQPPFSANSNGGLPQLANSGWQARGRCAPRFGNDSGSCPMLGLRYNLAAGESVPIEQASGTDLQYFFIAVVPRKNCDDNSLNSEALCTAVPPEGTATTCVWNQSTGTCEEDWCPPRVGPGTSGGVASPGSQCPADLDCSGN